MLHEYINNIWNYLMKDLVFLDVSNVLCKLYIKNLGISFFKIKTQKTSLTKIHKSLCKYKV